MAAEKDLPTLDQESAAKLTDFARACKAAARAVTLYPAAHPAIRVSLARLVDTAARLTAAGPVTFGVLPDNLLLGGSGAPKPDQAVRETGAMLHDHLIGIITMHSSPEPESWLPFLRLLSRPIDEVRAAGGVSRLWAASGHRHLDIQEIDYADILRDRGAGQDSKWDDIIRSCLNLEGPLLREFGFAALMHDIGKVNTPVEVLNKPDKLTKDEFEVMKRHVVDGAHILRKTPEMPALAPIVAFEHHLKQDLSGYPENIGSRKLNLCTMIVSIADVFDALRSNRPYRQGLASDRIKAIMSEQGNPAFNQKLLKRLLEDPDRCDALIAQLKGYLLKHHLQGINVDFEEVPHGPWAKYGDNNTFVLSQRQGNAGMAQARERLASGLFH